MFNNYDQFIWQFDDLTIVRSLGARKLQTIHPLGERHGNEKLFRFTNNDAGNGIFFSMAIKICKCAYLYPRTLIFYEKKRVVGLFGYLDVLWSELPKFSPWRRSMGRPFAFAINTLCLVHSITAEGCLPNTAIKFQDQHNGDRKQVTLSGNNMTIKPMEKKKRFFPQIRFYFHNADCQTISCRALYLNFPHGGCLLFFHYAYGYPNAV